MFGVIVFVQAVHYPLFAKVGNPYFMSYHRQHERLTTVVVLLPMTLELISSTFLFIFEPNEVLKKWFGFLLILNLMVWVVTGVFSVPTHQKLKKGFADKVHRRLVMTNWIRTIGWFLRTITISGIILFQLDS
jgi:hypothetical protein